MKKSQKKKKIYPQTIFGLILAMRETYPRVFNLLFARGLNFYALRVEANVKYLADEKKIGEMEENLKKLPKKEMIEQKKILAQQKFEEELTFEENTLYKKALNLKNQPSEAASLPQSRPLTAGIKKKEKDLKTPPDPLRADPGKKNAR